MQGIFKKNNSTITKFYGTLKVLMALVLFLSIYYLINFITGYRTRYLVGFNWEKKIPYVPEMFIIYYSIIILPFLIPIYITNRVKFNLILKRVFIALFLASISYLLFPAESLYPKISHNLRFIEKVTTFLTGHYNLVPSLHVAVSIIIVNSLWNCLKKFQKIIAIVYMVLLIASTMFTHQHNFIDVITGALLSFIVIYITNEKRIKGLS